MAMTIKTEGLTQLSEMLGKLGDKAQAVASGSLYKGAGFVADAFNQSVNSIVTEPFHYLAKPEITGTKRYASPEEKAALQNKVGIARFRKGGDSVDTIIGLSKAGYADVGGKQKAVQLIARSINSGTSFMQKQPFARRAVSSASGPAKELIVARAEEMFNEIINK